jgi:hypothetical protein
MSDEIGNPEKRNSEKRNPQKRNSEKTESGATAAVVQRGLSLDSWAVLLALAAAALVKLHILNSVKW